MMKFILLDTHLDYTPNPEAFVLLSLLLHPLLLYFSIHFILLSPLRL
jgi:hypothetical protein